MNTHNNNTDFCLLTDQIRAEAEKYDLSCTIIVSDGRNVQRMYFGEAEENDVYLLDGSSGFLLGLSVMLMDENVPSMLPLSIAEFIPAEELPETHANSELMMLMMHRTMMPDAVHGILLPEFHRSEGYTPLDADEAARRERELRAGCRSFSEQTALIRRRQLRYSTGLAPSSFDDTLLAELVRRKTGRSLAAFQRERIFEPLGITLAESEPDSGIFAASADRLMPLLDGLISHRLLDGENARTAEAIASGGRSIPFGRRQDILCARSGDGGSTVEMLLDRKTGNRVLIVSRDPLPEVRRFGQFRRLDLDIAQVMSAASFCPVRILMKPVSPRNLHEALSVEPDEEQQSFVSTPAAAIAEAQVSKDRAFVLFEKNTTVGLLTLADGNIPGDMLIDTLIIDRHYQRRGFGRMAVRNAIAFARKEGYLRVMVCVDRRNAAARALYDSLGFEICEVYDHAYVLVLDLDRR